MIIICHVSLSGIFLCFACFGTCVFFGSVAGLLVCAGLCVNRCLLLFAFVGYYGSAIETFGSIMAIEADGFAVWAKQCEPSRSDEWVAGVLKANCLHGIWSVCMYCLLVFGRY